MKRLLVISVSLVGIFAAGTYGLRGVADEKHEHHDEHEHEHEHGAEEAKPADAQQKKDSHEHGEESEHADEHGDEHGHEDEHGEHEEGSSSVGPGNAITEVSHKNGFRLSEAAVKTLGLKFQGASPGDTIKVPQAALVRYQDKVGIYRFRVGWFKLLEVAVLDRTTNPSVRVSGLKASDQIVIQGVPLLRVAELESVGGSGDGHGH